MFGTDSDFWQVDLDMRRFQSLARNHTLGLFLLYTGRTGEVGDGIAPWQTFGLGGSNSIRGYDVGTSIGINQWINTIEYRWNFLEPRPLSVIGLTTSLGLQLALFTDFGSVWDEGSEFRPNFIVGGGAGLRLLVPYVGLIRFDVGVGKNDPEFFFHISTKEKAVRQRERVR
jgi:outer membrane protein assembly factor BamA